MVENTLELCWSLIIMCVRAAPQDLFYFKSALDDHDFDSCLLLIAELRH